MSLSKIFTDLNQSIVSSNFSGTVLIGYKWKVLFKHAYGLADIELNVDNQVHSIFRIASISKQITASAILHLIESGKMSIDDLVSKYIPDFPNGDKITLHHLLSNSSGIANYNLEGDFHQALHSESPVLGLIEMVKPLPLNFEPGARFEYSNSGYLLLSYFIELASGLKYEDYLKKHFFEPLGMNSTGFDYYQRIVKNRSKVYDMSKGAPVNAMFIDMQIAGGGGGLYSTVGDLHIWNEALYSGKVLRQESFKKMISSQCKIIESTDYGYGQFLAKADFCGKVRRKYYHTGGGPGVRSINSIYPDDDMEIIIISNVNDNSTFAKVEDEIERVALENILPIL